MGYSTSTPAQRTMLQKLRMGRYLLCTLFLVVAIRLGLTFASYTALRRILPHFARPHLRQADDFSVQGAVRTAVWAVQRVSRLVPGATCLTQAIAAQFMLARQGQTSQVHIGVAKDEVGTFAAHAWVVWRGQTIIGGETSHYTPMTVFDLLPATSSHRS